VGAEHARSDLFTGQAPMTNQVRPSKNAIPRPSLARRSMVRRCLPVGTCGALLPPVGWKRRPLVLGHQLGASKMPVDR
jgi:hypothetical protein